MKIVELSPEQLEPLTRFVADLPDRDRTFLDDDVSDPHGVAALPARPGKRWVVVEDTEGAEITGFASVRPHSGWSNHVATLHLIVHPDHRHGGVGTELARYALASSLSEGLRKVQVEIAAEDESAINMFSQLGFTGEALLRDHIRGRDGQYRDLVVLAHLVDDIQRPDAEPAVGGARRGAFVSSEWTRVGVVRESNEGERRVALVPTAVAALVGKSVDVVVEADAGGGASIPDEAYVAAGASIGDAWSADVVVKVAPPSAVEVARLSEGQTLIGFLAPRDADNQIGALKDAGVQAFALEAIPRISRAQVMDALSSQANVAGYKAVVLAAWESTRFFPMLTTAAGTVKPAMVLVLGVGVAGLQALATAKRLGGRPTGYDVRPEVADQVRSVGAQWLDLGIEAAGEGGYARELTDEEKAQQQQKLEDAIKGFDVVITTALVPGRPAPRLVTAAAVQGMRPGSVIVDLAGETGGNCELTEPGETVVKHAVTICSPLNLPATMPEHASELYSKNISALLELMLKDRKLDPDFTDQVLADSCVTREKD